MKVFKMCQPRFDSTCHTGGSRAHTSQHKRRAGHGLYFSNVSKCSRPHARGCANFDGVIRCAACDCCLSGSGCHLGHIGRQLDVGLLADGVQHGRHRGEQVPNSCRGVPALACAARSNFLCFGSYGGMYQKREFRKFPIAKLSLQATITCIKNSSWPGPLACDSNANTSAPILCLHPTPSAGCSVS